MVSFKRHVNGFARMVSNALLCCDRFQEICDEMLAVLSAAITPTQGKVFQECRIKRNFIRNTRETCPHSQDIVMILQGTFLASVRFSFSRTCHSETFRNSSSGRYRGSCHAIVPR